MFSLDFGTGLIYLACCTSVTIDHYGLHLVKTRFYFTTGIIVLISNVRIHNRWPQHKMRRRFLRAVAPRTLWSTTGLRANESFPLPTQCHPMATHLRSQPPSLTRYWGILVVIEWYLIIHFYIFTVLQIMKDDNEDRHYQCNTVELL